MDNKIHQPHDSFAKRILSDVELVKELIQKHVSEAIAKRIYCHSLELTNKSFVIEELRNYHSDVVYKCEIENQEGYIYALIEHQSKPDEHMPFRLLTYNVALMEQHMSQGNKHLPIVINICLYAGKQKPYPYSTDIYDYFEDAELARQEMFKPFKLIDLTSKSQEELLKDGDLGLVEVLLKQGIQRDYLSWIRSNPILICKIIESKYGVSAAVYILGTDDKNEPEELIKALTEVSPKHKDIIMTAAYKLQQEAKQEGIKEEKLTIARNMLKKGYAIKDIQEIAELSKEAIEEIKKEA